MCGDSVWLYSRSVGVCAWCDGARGRRLQDLGGAHHHVKLAWILTETWKKLSFPQVMMELEILGFFLTDQGQRTAGKEDNLMLNISKMSLIEQNHITYILNFLRHVSLFPQVTFLTSCLCDGWVGGGLHRHGRGCSIADGGGGEISETRLSSHRLPARTSPVAERVLDNSLAKGGVGDKSLPR